MWDVGKGARSPDSRGYVDEPIGGQWRAMRHGTPGIYGSFGTALSVSYRI